MRRSLLLTLAWALLLGSVARAQQAPPSPYQLSVATDRPEAIYAAGEKVTFRITLKKEGQPAEGEVAYQTDKDGMPPFNRGTAKLENGAASVEGTLAEPGFLACRVTYATPEGKKVQATAAAGFDPLRIVPSMPAPDDFDAFWAKQKERLAAVPMDAKLTPVTSVPQGIECFEVELGCVPPRPVRGFLARPAGAAPKSLPAILCVHAAGVQGSSSSLAIDQAKTYGALAMDFNAHGILNNQPPEFYANLRSGELAGYPAQGRDSRDTCYFLGMFLRLQRAIDFITSQPEWNGKVLVVRGSSQGGGQSIVAAGLDPRVTLISAGVPAICDHTGRAIGRANGWPRLVPDADGKPDPKILQESRYFDAVNFAARSKAEALFSVGFIDTTCAPTSVYAAYNAWPGKKQMINEPWMTHAVSPKIGPLTAELIKAHIAARK